MCQVKKMLRVKKKMASENKTLLGTDLTASRESFRLLKILVCYEAMIQSREPRLTENVNAH